MWLKLRGMFCAIDIINSMTYLRVYTCVFMIALKLGEHLKLCSKKHLGIVRVVHVFIKIIFSCTIPQYIRGA